MSLRMNLCNHDIILVLDLVLNLAEDPKNITMINSGRVPEEVVVEEGCLRQKEVDHLHQQGRDPASYLGIWKKRNSNRLSYKFHTEAYVFLYCRRIIHLKQFQSLITQEIGCEILVNIIDAFN
mmetsp:Transcript_25290/g.50364  ORF Transcript_25290/g.50364 Transcript_25290/m.50364 type:complete len:123 (-) Transcript_25290:5-373(-)